MPLLTNDCEDLGQLIGEHLNDDVETWEVERDGKGAVLRVTRSGRDYEIAIKLRESSKGD